MKEGLIRLTDEKDIFYDSIERVYRYRQHCPQCNVALPKCMCYNDLDLLLNDIDDGISDFTCSSKCALIIGEWDELEEAMLASDVHKDMSDLIRTLSDEQMKEYLKKEYEGCNIYIDWDKRTRENMITMLKENNLREDILEFFDVSRGKSIEELTEEEASKVLTILTEDGDFDAPHGDYCNT